MVFGLLALGNIDLLHANIPHARLLDPKACKGDTITPPGVGQKRKCLTNKGTINQSRRWYSILQSFCLAICRLRLGLFLFAFVFLECLLLGVEDMGTAPLCLP